MDSPVVCEPKVRDRARTMRSRIRRAIVLGRVVAEGLKRERLEKKKRIYLIFIV